jgi:hypothetical protein
MAAYTYFTTDSLDLLAFNRGPWAWASVTTFVLSLLPSGAHPAVFMILVPGSVQPVVI